MKDLTGKRFGKLMVLKNLGKVKNGGFEEWIRREK